MTLTWEHPLNKKRRLNRTAFSEATKNALPRNVINKIFSYKEAANYLKNKYPIAKNQVLNEYTRWLANSNSKMNMNTSEKLEFLDKTISSIGHANTAKYINLINSRNQLSKLSEYLRLVSEDSTMTRKFSETGYVRKFLKQNDTTKKEIFNVLRNKRLWWQPVLKMYKIIGLMGNRDEMLRILKGRLNQAIQTKQKVLNDTEKLTSKKRPRMVTRGQVKRNNINGRVFKIQTSHIQNLKRQKSNLQNLTTSTLRNKIKRLESDDIYSEK